MVNKKRIENSYVSCADGFTLIELLVVIGIIGVLTSFGIAAYSRYNASQLVQVSATNVATQLAFAKSHAISQVIPSSPSNCSSNHLTGYQVAITPSGQQYTVSAICGTPQMIATNALPPQVSFAARSTASVFFAVSSGISSGSATIYLTGYGKTKTITVSKIGNIAVN